MTEKFRYIEHYNPRWAYKTDHILQAYIEELGYYESLWTAKVGDNGFELCCIPFATYDLAIGDIVSAKSTSLHKYEFDALISKSGRRTMRAIMNNIPDEIKVEICDDLLAGDVDFEWYSDTLVGISALGQVQEDHAVRVLNEYFDKELLQWEYGN